MDIKKLFLQIISILLIVIVVVCIGITIKRNGEPEKEYVFSERTNSLGSEDWGDTEDMLDATEGDSLVGDSESGEGDEMVSTTPQNKIMYTISAVNVRSGPGRGYDWLGRLDQGAEVTAVGEAVDDWQQVIYNGKTAYIAVEYLEVREEAESSNTGDEENTGTGSTGGTGTANTGTGNATIVPSGTTTPSNSESTSTTTPEGSENSSVPDTPSNSEVEDMPIVPETPTEPEQSEDADNTDESGNSSDLEDGPETPDASNEEIVE